MGVLGAIWSFISIIAAIFTTIKYLQGKTIISSGIDGTANLYIKHFGIFFAVYFLIGIFLLAALKMLLDFIASIILWIIGIVGIIALIGIYFYMQQQAKNVPEGEVFDRKPYLIIMGIIAAISFGAMGYSLLAPSDNDTKLQQNQTQNQKSKKAENKISNNVNKNDGNTQKAHNDYKDSLEKEKEKLYANHGAKDLYSDEPILLGNIPLGLVESDVKKLLGKAEKIEQRSSGKTVYHYNNNGYDVICKEGRVIGLVSDSPQITTEAGIHTGSNLQDFLQKYGTNYTLSNYDGLDLYEYNGNNQGKKIILRFAVKPDTKKVNYISLRYAD